MGFRRDGLCLICFTRYARYLEGEVQGLEYLRISVEITKTAGEVRPLAVGGRACSETAKEGL